jgi:hypothetical protein
MLKIEITGKPNNLVLGAIKPKGLNRRAVICQGGYSRNASSALHLIYYICFLFILKELEQFSHLYYILLILHAQNNLHQVCSKKPSSGTLKITFIRYAQNNLHQVCSK